MMPFTKPICGALALAVLPMTAACASHVQAPLAVRPATPLPPARITLPRALTDPVALPSLSPAPISTP